MASDYVDALMRRLPSAVELGHEHGSHMQGGVYALLFVVVLITHHDWWGVAGWVAMSVWHAAGWHRAHKRVRGLFDAVDDWRESRGES